MFRHATSIFPHPDGRHCGDCAKMVVYDGCHCAVPDFFEDPETDDFLEYEDDFKALRCHGCLEAERKWRERGKILVQCTLCKGEWENSSFCSCCGSRFFPASYIPVSGPVLVPCWKCRGTDRAQADHRPCDRCGRDGCPPGWIPLVEPASETT